MTYVPDAAQIIQWIQDNPTLATKRDIAKAFHIKGAQKIDLKRLLKQLEADGQIKLLTRKQREFSDLPSTLVVQITGLDDSGSLVAQPLVWDNEAPPPLILLSENAGRFALATGDHALTRITAYDDPKFAYTGHIFRKIERQRSQTLGIFKISSEGGRALPVDKSNRSEWLIPAHLTQGAKDGELVELEQIGGRGRLGLVKAKVITRLGSPMAPKSMSLIAIHQHGILDHFDDDVLQEAEAAQEPDLTGRIDLRDMPFVTIDPEDARDHDDACYVAHDTDPNNKGGFVIWVAIADIAHYVRPQSALDQAARQRGNSTYFPDRVVPMLPDRLSGDLCSLHEGVDRAAIVAEMRIDAHGQKRGQTFHRALIHSHASLTYEEVQGAKDGHVSERLKPLMSRVIEPLYTAYAALKIARKARGPLELDLPERQIRLSDDGGVQSVTFKERFDAHKLIEEFMVLANVAAAETLLDKKTPQMFRVHEPPHPEKLEALREVAQSAGFKFAKGQVILPQHLNQLLTKAKGTDHSELINMSTLRAMTQAYYHPDHAGHFGLALHSYAHFTSPIRRYADLIVHRALVSAHGWGADGLSSVDVEQLSTTAQLISEAERRSMVAERDTNDRYLAAYLSDLTGTKMQGRISGIASFGAFIRLEDTGADALVPMRNLGAEYFHFDKDAGTLTGEKTRLKISLGDPVVVKLSDVDPATGGLIVDLVEIKGQPMAQRHKRTSRKTGKYGKKGKSNPKVKKRLRTRLRTQ